MWACGDEGVHHSFRGVKVDIHEWSQELKQIQQDIVKDFDVYTNFLLVNHYRNGYDSIAPHSDGELFAKNHSLFTLGLGATRKMQLIPYQVTANNKPIEFLFEQGDSLLMCGPNTQKKWKHGIQVEPNVLNPRYSFTCRSTSTSLVDSQLIKSDNQVGNNINVNNETKLV